MSDQIVSTTSTPMEPADSEVVEETAPVEAAPVTDTPAVEETTEAEPDPETESLEIREKAADVLSEAGLDMNAFSQEYADTGGLSDETFNKLETAGFPRDLVDRFIEGQQALAAQAETFVQQTAFDAVGGKEEYQKMTKWAESSMTAQEIAAFNTAVTSMDAGQASLAVSGLAAKYAANYGQEGATVQGSASPTTSGASYENQAALVADLSDPKYQSSPSFRAEVEAKVARSMERHGGSIPS